MATCSNCGNEFEQDSTRRYKKKFCSRSCSNKRSHSNSTKNKISESLKTGRKRNCQYCGNEFSMNDRRGKYCSWECVKEKRREHLDEYAKYRRDCLFNFSLNDYPDEFDFKLIEEHGWYKAKNNGDNLNGVSRDHIISIKYGFKNNIPAKVISHPANCQLLLHSDNASKFDKCSISIEQLYRKIEEWNSKY